MVWLLEIAFIWLTISLLVLATGWYLSTLVPRLWPDWWRRVVIDLEPDAQVVSKNKLPGAQSKEYRPIVSVPDGRRDVEQI